MSLTVRRVVTGHDENGRAIVSIDETFKNVVQTRPGAHAAVIWTSEGFPVDNDGSADTSGRKIGIATIDNGTVFRVMRFGPGVTPRNHRTDTMPLRPNMVLQALEESIARRYHEGHIWPAFLGQFWVKPG